MNPAGFYGNNDHLSIPPSKLMEEFKRTQPQFYHDLAREAVSDQVGSYPAAAK
jgi:hypothetical protein